MEWYVDDLIVPGEQNELSYIIPSPESWSPWGATEVGSFECSKNFYGSINMGNQVFDFDKSSFCTGFDTNISGHEGDHSSDPSVCQGLSECQQTGSLREKPNCRLVDQSGTDQKNDIFFNSFFEDLTSTNSLQGLFSFSWESQFAMMPADNLLTDMISDTECGPSCIDTSLERLKTYSVSPLAGLKKGEFGTTCPPSEELVTKASVSSKEDYLGRHKISPEEAVLQELEMVTSQVLQELEMVTSQLTEKTRVCFRDALYRLAENSKHTTDHCNNADAISGKDPTLTVNPETFRGDTKEVRESKTNAIDRAIANLMFSGALALPAAESLNFKQGATGVTGNLNQALDLQEIPCVPIFLGDAEFQMFGEKNQPLPIASLH